MERVIKLAKFQLRDSRNALLIFYAVCAAVLSLFAFTFSTGDGQISGFGMAALIFIFIAGLNCFSTAFRFAQANNVSRKRFFLATSLSLLAIAAFMAAVDATATVLIRQFFPYEGLMEQLYQTKSLIPDFLWSFALFAFAAHAGWLITMVYYRSNPWVQTLVSIAPVFAMFVLSHFNGRSGGVLVERIIDWLGRMLGLSGLPNPYVAVGSFLVGATLAAAGSWLLVRRASVRG